jgi:hypothetical protein
LTFYCERGEHWPYFVSKTNINPNTQQKKKRGEALMPVVKQLVLLYFI